MTKKAQAPFEESLTRLEGIVRRMEDGKLTLDESMALYEEGVKLAAVCRSRLNLARSRVTMLVENGEGVSEVESQIADE